ncbi:MAG: demethoxyubiquinone hydroxylase family protein [Candidatus Fonsibacter ubiquis]|jgi:ubiquinone biosynthesis monooxygenase Coq7
MDEKKRLIDEMIRVNHAGERGAIKIYEGQLKALKLLNKDPELQDIIKEMRDHELEHLKFFEEQIIERQVRPTVLLPIWDLLGTALGFGTALLGKKATTLCTSSVEEVIGGHYGEQIDILSKKFKEEKELKKKFEKFREEELEHKDKAEQLGANNDGLYSLLDTVIKNSSKFAIAISKRY